jgi:hypothetical protein
MGTAQAKRTTIIAKEETRGFLFMALSTGLVDRCGTEMLALSGAIVHIVIRKVKDNAKEYVKACMHRLLGSIPADFRIALSSSFRFREMLLPVQIVSLSLARIWFFPEAGSQNITMQNEAFWSRLR